MAKNMVRDSVNEQSLHIQIKATLSYNNQSYVKKHYISDNEGNKTR